MKEALWSEIASFTPIISSMKVTSLFTVPVIVGEGNSYAPVVI